MSLLHAIVLGLVQGVTEFLPISSTAHLRLVPALLGWPDPGAAYSAVIQLGTLGAVLAYFARDLMAMARGLLRGIASRAPLGDPQGRLAVFVLVGTVPIGVAGVLSRRAIETTLRGLPVIAAALIALAVVLFIAERLSRRDHPIDALTFGQSQAIGLAQALALVPGVSRSGVTLTAGLGCGLTRDAAARFSFLLSVPAVTAAGLFQFRALLSTAGGPDVPALVAGIAAAFGSGYLAIGGLLRFLRTRSTLAFVVYRIVLGVLIAALVATGRLPG